MWSITIHTVCIVVLYGICMGICEFDDSLYSPYIRDHDHIDTYDDTVVVSVAHIRFAWTGTRKYKVKLESDGGYPHEHPIRGKTQVLKVCYRTGQRTHSRHTRSLGFNSPSSPLTIGPGRAEMGCNRRDGMQQSDHTKVAGEHVNLDEPLILALVCACVQLDRCIDWIERRRVRWHSL